MLLLAQYENNVTMSSSTQPLTIRLVLGILQFQRSWLSAIRMDKTRKSKQTVLNAIGKFSKQLPGQSDIVWS